MSLCRVIIQMLGDKINTLTIQGEQVFVVDNDMLANVDWSLNRLVMINELMIAGQCIKNDKYRRLKIMEFA